MSPVLLATRTLVCLNLFTIIVLVVVVVHRHIGPSSFIPDRDDATTIVTRVITQPQQQEQQQQQRQWEQQQQQQQRDQHETPKVDDRRSVGGTIVLPDGAGGGGMGAVVVPSPRMHVNATTLGLDGSAKHSETIAPHLRMEEEYSQWKTRVETKRSNEWIGMNGKRRLYVLADKASGKTWFRHHYSDLATERGYHITDGDHFLHHAEDLWEFMERPSKPTAKIDIVMGSANYFCFPPHIGPSNCSCTYMKDAAPSVHFKVVILPREEHMRYILHRRDKARAQWAREEGWEKIFDERRYYMWWCASLNGWPVYDSWKSALYREMFEE